jgi:predicted N-acetyltransferase YhbS
MPKDAKVTLRRPTPADVPGLARIVYDAFGGIADRHNFPRDFPAMEMASGMAGMVSSHPAFFGVVAEAEGRVVGSNFLDERDPIRGVGPITVDPNSQQSGVGRKLMEAVIARWRETGAPGIRLVQDAFNTTSMSLYTAVGFDVKEPLALLRGKPRGSPRGGGVARKVEERDLAACSELCTRVHGFTRVGELRDAMTHFGAMLLERGGRVVAYATAPWFWIGNHAVAETEADLREMVLGMGAASADGRPLEILTPIRRSPMFRWLLSQGLRVVKPMTLMAMGEYIEPRGAFWPSVAY